MVTNDLGMEQERRTVRAFTEEMSFTLAPNGWVVTSAKGCYLVPTGGRCGCPDSQYRLAGTEAICKHEVALRRHLLETGGNLGPEDRAACAGCGEVLPARQVKAQASGERLCRHCEPVAAEVDVAEQAAKESALDRIFFGE